MIRRNLGITSSWFAYVIHAGSPELKTTVGLKMADILYQLGYIKKGHL
jgi:hypothetical protein